MKAGVQGREGAEEPSDPPGVKLQAGNGYWEANSGPLQEQEVLLTADLSLQPH